MPAEVPVVDDDSEEDDEVDNEEEDYEDEKPAAKKAKGAAGKAPGGKKGGQAAKGTVFGIAQHPFAVLFSLQGCSEQAALERQALPCMYLAHHKLSSINYIFRCCLPLL